VCLDSLVPDLSLATLKANMIDPEEITGLDPIGAGSFADVFKVTYSPPPSLLSLLHTHTLLSLAFLSLMFFILGCLQR
jgi:hypothetical protein